MKKGVLSIDKYNLDEEWVKQPESYEEAARMLAEATFDYDEMKAKFEVVKAEAELDIRDFPKKYKMKVPVREAAVKLKVILHPRVQKFRRILNRRKRSVGYIQGLVTSLDHKKKGLEKMCDLDARDYFSKPRANSESAKERTDAAERKALRSKGHKKRPK